MTTSDDNAMRTFATTVVQKLRDAGYQALWAGGCVRDQLLARTPKDYDVATSARPEEIRQVFGHRWTLPIGAAFGVITVLGPKKAGQIEVATFREDAEYSDGRHPDSVAFSTPEHDAQRRDFTINGLFYDPLEQQVIDYVGGQEDLAAQVIRAIGDPEERISEDKLRMLRAVRFATTFKFRIDEVTLQAIQDHALEIEVVSAERIGVEMRKILLHDNRRVGVELLRQTRLLEKILPEFRQIAEHGNELVWNGTLRILDELRPGDFCGALAALLAAISTPTDDKTRVVASVADRWRLTNQELRCVKWLLQKEPVIADAAATRWSTVQRILIADYVEDLLEYCRAVGAVRGSTDGVDFCREKLRLPAEQLDPAPLIRGDDLMRAGLPRGPQFKTLLEETRNAQLEGEITNKEQALSLALSLWQEMQTP